MQLFLFTQLSKYFPEFMLEVREVAFDYIPNQRQVNSKVVVNHDIPKSSYASPVNFWVAVFQRFRKSHRGFS